MAAPLTLPQQIRNRDRERLRRYARNLAFYRGKQWPRNDSRSRRLILNYTRNIITKTTGYLLTGRSNTVTPDDPTDAARARADEAQLALEQLHDQNALSLLDHSTELDCAVLGDAAYKVIWDPTDTRVRVSAPDPSGIFAWHWPDDPSRIWRIANRFRLDADSVRATLPDIAAPLQPHTWITEAWTIATVETFLGDALISSQPNPYGFIPFIIINNVLEPGELWGTSDIDFFREAQEELNREATQISQVLELSGNPIAVLENVTDTEAIAVRPGALWELPADAKAYLLDLLRGGGVKLHTDWYDTVQRALNDLSHTPRAAFGDTRRDLSGVALELELDPIIKHIERKRLSRTPAYRARNEMMLAILDQFTDTALRAANHSISWGSVLPIDRDRDIRNEVSLTAAGIHSRTTAIQEIGGIDDPEAEFTRALDEAAQLAAASANTNPTP